MRTELVVTLGGQLFGVERAWGSAPKRERLVGITSVAVDSADRVFVVQAGDRPVEIFDQHGNHLQSWGGHAIFDGHAIFIGEDDRVIVTDRDAHQVLVFGATGDLQLALGNRDRPRLNRPFNHPAAATFGVDGDIYVADGYGNASVHHFDREGVLLGTWGRLGARPGVLLAPIAIAVDTEGRVLVADHGTDRIEIFTAEGEYVTAWTDFWRPMDVWVGRNGMAYVTDQMPRLSIISSDGTLCGRCRPVPAMPLSVRADSIGDLYLAEGQIDEVMKLVRLTDTGAAA